VDLSIDRVERIVHGALDYAELERLGLRAQDMLDFSVNSNPYGPSPHVREALLQLSIDRYPDRACLDLQRAILSCELAKTDVAHLSIVCGNGTAELIWCIARALLKPGLKVGIIGPTFGEYRAACRAVGATIVEFRTDVTQHFQLDTIAVASWIEREQPVLVWLCNPNNPTGIWLDKQQILPIAQACQHVGATLIVDEAYHHFVIPHEDFSSIELQGPNDGHKVIVLRSLTKDYALAGLRLGYALVTPDCAQRLRRQLPSWNVSGAAQDAGRAALADQQHLTHTLRKLASEREEFFQALKEGGLPPMPSRTHFCLLDVGDAPRIRLELLRRNIVVRDCTSFGLPSLIRVATRRKEDWQRLLPALRSVL
jgi:histidinol-phosphate aminotransferase